MRPHCSLRFALVMALGLTSVWITQARGKADRTDIDSLVAQVGRRVAAYYHRAQQLICIERSTVAPISDWTIAGFARTVESELRVELDAADGDNLPDAHLTRDIRSINGRKPQERDKKSRDGCSDPNPISPEPLAFLLPRSREEYRFTAVREATERHRAALVIDFTSAQRKGRPELLEDDRGHDDCFSVKGPLAITGRLWVDATTHDVLRLERHVAGPTSVRVSMPLQRKYNFDTYVTLDRDDETLRYKEVTFQDPDEVVMLPDSIESMIVFRGGLQSIRITQGFSEYRRFLTDTRIIRGR